MRRLLIFGGLLFIAYSLYRFWPRTDALVSSRQIYGVSFSSDHARYLGLDPSAVYRTILNEWGFKYVRLSAQWNLIEPERGMYVWQELDNFFAEAAAHGAKIILVVGEKTPRWPECHLPVWARDLSDSDRRSARVEMMTTVVDHFKDHPALEMWQVENEPLFTFGECTGLTSEQLAEEIKLVKDRDPHHPTLVTDSGELSLWRQTARAADWFGATLYRVVWNEKWGYTNYDWWLPAATYRWKLWLNNRAPSTAMISELQAEPWAPNKDIFITPLEEQEKSMTVTRLEKTIRVAEETGFARAYLWGAEWWYWMHQKHGRDEFFEFVKTLKKG